MNRRRFLRIGAAGAAALSGLTTVACDDGGTIDLREPTPPELLGALGPDATRAIGRRYRVISPAENDVRSLRAAIMADRPWSTRLGLRRTPIAAQVRADFAEGRTVVIDGWLLSVTEARQCALYSLMPA